MKEGGSCKNLTSMYECETVGWGESLNCRDKADCLEIQVGQTSDLTLVNLTQGMFECRDGQCRTMLDYSCERRCKAKSSDRLLSAIEPTLSH